MRTRSAIVIGGGWAGIAAATRLAEAGVRVTLLEARDRLGGRAASYTDPQSGTALDCQHVLLGCCTNLIDLLNRLGSSGAVEWHDTLHFLDAGGRHDSFRRSRVLPAPLHLAPSLLRSRLLGWRAKRAVAMGMRALMSQEHADEGDAPPPSAPFDRWLEAHGQPAEAVERFWNLVLTSALNAELSDTDTTVAAKVFRDGFLGHRDGYLLGLPRPTLSSLHAPVTAFLEARGGAVRTKVRVTELLQEARGICGVCLANGERLEADVYVVAVPSDRAVTLLESVAELRGTLARAASRLRPSPIVGVHLWYDRPVLDLPHAALVDCPFQWLFNRGAGPDGSHHVHAVASAADGLVSLPPQEIVARADHAVARFVPATRGASPVRGLAVKERRATFVPAPGVDAVRPAAATAVPNLFLAGDWCASGWPATMEGAVRSGYLAAGAVLGRPLLGPDLPPSWLARLLGRSGRWRREVSPTLAAQPAPLSGGPACPSA